MSSSQRMRKPVEGAKAAPHGAARGDELAHVDIAKLTIIHYPDPRLRKRAEAITHFGPELAALTQRMIVLMTEQKGVGLAAPQVGILKRVFIMNATGAPDDTRVLVNPVLTDLEGTIEAEEGCLSLPGVDVKVRRALRCTVRFQDVHGHPFELVGEQLVSRIWQHETDHLNGILILDRMGPSDRIATRKTVLALERAYKNRA